MFTIDDEGWVKLHRKILDNPVFKDREALQLFLYCLLRANYKPNDFIFNGQVVHLERGQFIFGLRKASKALKMSIRKLRTRLLVLRKLGITTHQTTHRFSIITICNYNQYQDTQNEKGHNKRQTDDTLTTTNKKDNKEKNNGRASKKTDADPNVKTFLSWWGESFTRKTGKPYPFDFGKDGTLIKQLLKTYPVEELQLLANSFFKDEQAQRRGFSIGIFKVEIPRLITVRSLNPIEQAKREMGETRFIRARHDLKTFNPVEEVARIYEEGSFE